jgi:hypothetical protein
MVFQLMGVDLERMWKETTMQFLKHIPGICLEYTMEKTKILPTPRSKQGLL